MHAILLVVLRARVHAAQQIAVGTQLELLPQAVIIHIEIFELLDSNDVVVAAWMFVRAVRAVRGGSWSPTAGGDRLRNIGAAA